MILRNMTKQEALTRLRVNLGATYQKALGALEELDLSAEDVEKALKEIDVYKRKLAVFSKGLYPDLIATFMLVKRMKDLNSELPSFKIIDGTFLNDMWFNGEGAPEEMRYKNVVDVGILIITMSDSSFTYSGFSKTLHDVVVSREKEGKSTWLVFKGDYDLFKKQEGNTTYFDSVYRVESSKNIIKREVKTKTSGFYRPKNIK